MVEIIYVSITTITIILKLLFVRLYTAVKSKQPINVNLIYRSVNSNETNIVWLIECHFVLIVIVTRPPPKHRKLNVRSVLTRGGET